MSDLEKPAGASASDAQTPSSDEVARLRAELEASRAHIRWLNESMEQRVAERSAELRAIFDNLVVGIVTFDEKGAIEACNGAAERMFGYAHNELIGKSLQTIIAHAPRDKADSRFAWLIGAGATSDDGSSLEWRAESASSRVANLIGRCKDGSTFPMQIGATEVKGGGGRRFTAVIRNLTRKWRLEEALRQAQKLQIVGRLVSSITHDFNNLLMGVGGCIDIARSKLDAQHPALRFLDEAKRSMTTRIPLARPLLMFIKQEETHFVSREVDAVIEYNKEMLRRLLGSDIELRIRLAAPDAKVSCPEGALEEILMNLSANARDAMTEGGQLCIDTRVLFGEWLLLQVSGHRTKLDSHDSAYPKEAQRTPKEVKQRTILSLGTIYNIVKQSGGHLAIGFEPSEELALSVLLPVWRGSDEAALLPPQPLIAPPAFYNVLIVAAVEERLGLRTQLEQLGYKIYEASDGAAALALGRQAEQRMDLLILDVDLLQREAAGRLEAELAALNPDLTTVYISQESVEGLMRMGRVSPGMIVLKKPPGDVTLRAALALALAGRAPQPPPDAPPVT